jgi:hypothetical protein
VTITGGNRIWPRGKKYPRLFRRVSICYHPLLLVTSDRALKKDVDLEALTDQLEQIISEKAA